MNETPPPSRLEDTVAAAAREAAEQDERTRAHALRQGTRRRSTPRLALAALLLSAALAVLAWATRLRVDGPDADELQRHREVVLRLAAQAVTDHFQRQGSLPGRIEEVLPVAAEVRIQAVPQGVRLTLSDGSGEPRELIVPLQKGPR